MTTPARNQEGEYETPSYYSEELSEEDQHRLMLGQPPILHEEEGTVERSRPVGKKPKASYKDKEFKYPEYFDSQEKIGDASFGAEVFTPFLQGHIDTWEGSRRGHARQTFDRVVGGLKEGNKSNRGLALSKDGNLVGIGSINYEPDEMPEEGEWIEVESLVLGEGGKSEAAIRQILNEAAKQGRGIIMQGSKGSSGYLKSIGMKQKDNSFYWNADDVKAQKERGRAPEFGEYRQPASRPILGNRFEDLYEEHEVNEAYDERLSIGSSSDMDHDKRDRWDRFNWDAWEDETATWTPEEQIEASVEAMQDPMSGMELDEEAEYSKAGFLNKVKDGGRDSMAYAKLGEGVAGLFGGTPREAKLKNAGKYEKDTSEEEVWPRGKLEKDDPNYERELTKFAKGAEGVGDEDLMDTDVQGTSEFIFSRTQERMEEAGFEPEDTVRLYRGVPAHLLPREKDGGWLKLKLDALSSWTYSKTIAAQASSKKGNGALLRVDIPVSRIYSMWATGPGRKEAMEYLILGQDGIDAYATRLQLKSLKQPTVEEEEIVEKHFSPIHPGTGTGQEVHGSKIKYGASLEFGGVESEFESAQEASKYGQGRFTITDNKRLLWALFSTVRAGEEEEWGYSANEIDIQAEVDRVVDVYDYFLELLSDPENAQIFMRGDRHGANMVVSAEQWQEFIKDADPDNPFMRRHFAGMNIIITNNDERVGAGSSGVGGKNAKVFWEPVTLDTNKQVLEKGSFAFGISPVYVLMHELHHGFGSASELDTFSNAIAADYYIKNPDILGPKVEKEMLNVISGDIWSGSRRASGEMRDSRLRNRAMTGWLYSRNTEYFDSVFEEVREKNETGEGTYRSYGWWAPVDAQEKKVKQWAKGQGL